MSTGLFQNFSQEAQDYRNRIDAELARQDYERVRSGQAPLYDSRYTANRSQLDEYEQLYRTLLNIEDEQTRGRMGLANFYRTAEGETAGQRDEQAFRRLSTQLDTQRSMQSQQLENQRFMQNRGQELVNWQRDMDYDRANRSISQYRGMRMGGASSFR